MAALYRTYRAASQQLEVAYQARYQAEATLTYPELPQTLRMTVQDSVDRNQAKIGHYHHMLAQLQGQAAADRWRKEHVAAWEAYERQRAEHHREIGYTALADAEDAASVECDAAWAALRDAVPGDLHAVQIQIAAAADWLFRGPEVRGKPVEDLDFGFDVLPGLLVALERLTGETVDLEHGPIPVVREAAPGLAGAA